MKTADAIAELSDRYTVGSDYDVKDVTGFLSSLDVEDVGTVLQCIIRNHEYNTFPKLPKIKKYIEKDNVPINSKAESIRKVFDYYVCQVCKSIYNTELGRCPICKKATEVKVLLSKTKLDGAYEGHNGCSVCPKYNNRNICITCDMYGRPFSSEICRDCQGLECCTDYKNRKGNKLVF